MTTHRPHKAMKDSGVAWLGEIPAHWDVRRLGQFFFERREKVSDKDFPPLSVTKNGVVPQLETAAKTDDGDNRKKVCVGDFVINSRSDRKGSSGVSPHDGSVSLINTVLQPSGGLRINFVNHLLRSLPFQEEFYRVGNGIVADMWTTKYSEMKTIQVPVPDEIEQQAIATHLDRETARIDALIAKKTRFIELLAEKRQALITRAVTKGLNPKAKMKDSGVAWLGEVPEHWAIPKLRHIATIQTGIAKGKDYRGAETVVVPYLRVANVQDGYLDLTDIQEIEIPKAELSRYLLKPGDVLMNEGGDNDKLGRGHIWNGEISRCVHQNHVYAVRPSEVSSEWLNVYTSSIAAQSFFTFRSKQTTNLASISSNSLMDLPVPKPPCDEQNDIISYIDRSLSRIKNIVDKTERSIELLREHRTALITAAVTGKIDLRDTA